MIRMFFFDIDGTLIDPRVGEVSPAVRRAISLLQERRIEPILVTGRPPFAVTPLAESLGIRGWVAYNGGLAVMEGERVYNNPIDPAKLEQLVPLADAQNHPLVFPGLDDYYTTVANHPYVQKIFRYPPQFAPAYWQDHPIYQVELIAPNEEVAVYMEHFARDFHFYPWHVATSATNVNPLTNSKAVGMRAILQSVGLDESAAAAIGDGPNDVEMIRAAELGIAMGNASDTLKAAADLVTDLVSVDGAAKVIEELLKTW
ncbi:HAD family hydrolase [Alicyclobacillus shizuokensis]|uniref:HAD family hydrolase n=1 Tax=Alicyclobacillus shizuokensis TaxID=392014 RepID=UPI0008339BFC|nr:HAD family hydrolase [Alicyclobacillus shizuokensis]